DLGFLDFLQYRRRDLASGVGDLMPALVLDAVRQLQSQQVRRLLNGAFQRPAQLLVFQADAVNRVERAENVFIGAQPQGAQKDGTQEFALAVNADVKNVLLVVFKLHPRSAIGNDLAQEVSPVVRGLKEHAG